MDFETFKEEVDKNIDSLFNKANSEEKTLLNRMINVINDLCKEKQELISYLKEQIKLCKEAKRLALENKMIEQVSNFNLRIASYKEILSKIEKE